MSQLEGGGGRNSHVKVNENEKNAQPGDLTADPDIVMPERYLLRVNSLARVSPSHTPGYTW